jgi:hypothetical protein
MELLDRYLQAVKRCLPRENQDDILKELSANILAAMDDREAELGRPLTADEQIAILDQQGSPTRVASRYRHEQNTVAFGRVLIGPEVFPLYRRILSLNVGLSLAAAVVVHFAFGNRVTFGALLLPATIQFVVVTAIFTGIQWSQQKHGILDRWNPRALPPVQDRMNISRSGTLVEMFFTVLFLLCWLRVPGAAFAVAYMFLGPAASYFSPINSSPLLVTPAWQFFYLPILIMVLLQLCEQGLNFAFPRWTRARLLGRVVRSSLGVLLVVYLFRAGDVLLVNPDVHGSGQYVPFAMLVNQSVHYSLLLGAILSAFQIAKQLFQILRLPTSASPSRSASVAI